ncbi:MAG TPA: DUF1743 domain-containing protein, partial [Acidilobales archaeon]|nr:DUF1743 domain-containing protein [Acidilobales archaeon]
HLDFVRNVVGKVRNRLILPLGLNRGVIGALAAIGWFMEGDCTYELIAYRFDTSRVERCVDERSVIKMDIKFKQWVFSNYDYESRKQLITPHGPDPVLLGIRGEDPRILVKAFEELKICEDVEGWLIFRTNQGTDAHHIDRDINYVRPYQSGCIKGVVDGNPRVLRGGDVIINIQGGNNAYIYAAFFKETSLTRIAKKLIKGDYVRLCGTFKLWEGLGLVVHVEKLTILKAVDEVVKMNPLCPKCGSRMKSAGRGKGWKCPKCGFRSKNLPYDVKIISRSNLVGDYIPLDKAIKHLNKPLRRYGRERVCRPERPSGTWIL